MSLHNKFDSDEEEEDNVEHSSVDDNDDDGRHISDSDIEGAESGSDDLPNDKAWGKLRRSFYNTDYLDKDHGGSNLIFKDLS